MELTAFKKLCFGVSFAQKPKLSSIENNNGDKTPGSFSTDISSHKDSVSKKKRRRRGKKSDDPLICHQQEMNMVRNRHKIHVAGGDIADPITSFQELAERYEVHSQLIGNISQAGYLVPTPVQVQALPVMIDRRSTTVCAPTGSGKTAAFVIPILHYLNRPRRTGVRALILAPTRELSNQTLHVCRQLADGTGIRCCFLKGVESRQTKLSGKRYDLMVSTPNRLVFLLKKTPPAMDLSCVEWLVVDESDKLFEDGATGFRDQLAVIFNACSSPSLRHALFSATFSNDVKIFCKETMDSLVEITVGTRNSAVNRVKQELLFCGTEHGKTIAIRDIFRKPFEPPVLIFLQSVQRAKQLFNELRFEKVKVDVIHKERIQAERDVVTKAFADGHVWVLICTELMGRGIDFQNVNLVINYDFPTTTISYIHRIGRTGRAGKSGRALTFFTEADFPYLRNIANIVKDAGGEVPEYMMQIKKLPRHLKKRRIPIKRPRISTQPFVNNKRKSHEEVGGEVSSKKKLGTCSPKEV